MKESQIINLPLVTLAANSLTLTSNHLHLTINNLHLTINHLHLIINYLLAINHLPFTITVAFLLPLILPIVFIATGIPILSVVFIAVVLLSLVLAVAVLIAATFGGLRVSVGTALMALHREGRGGWQGTGGGGGMSPGRWCNANAIRFEHKFSAICCMQYC